MKDTFAYKRIIDIGRKRMSRGIEEIWDSERGGKESVFGCRDEGGEGRGTLGGGRNDWVEEVEAGGGEVLDFQGAEEERGDGDGEGRCGCHGVVCMAWMVWLE